MRPGRAGRVAPDAETSRNAPPFWRGTSLRPCVGVGQARPHILNTPNFVSGIGALSLRTYASKFISPSLAGGWQVVTLLGGAGAVTPRAEGRA
jgi:hypothetical protein